MIRIEKRPEKDSPASLKVNYVKESPALRCSIRAISALHIG
ncbi:hypothetical protein U8P71_08990 [Rhizobium ruizarguesonis]|nr:hypothetical protein U8P71_08990 [Rhizobium ruizarguesonis]